MSRSKPSILFLHSSNELYGADRSLLWLVRSVMGVARPIVVVPDDLPYDGALAARLRQEGVDVRVGHVPVLRRHYLGPLALPRWLIRAFRDTVGLSLMGRRERIVGLVTNTSGVVVGPLVARLIGRPHIWYLREIVEQPRWFRSFVRIDARAARGVVVAVSSAVAAWLGPLPGLGPEIGYNGVDVEPAPAPLPPLPTIAFVGRLNAWKGHEVFIAAAALVHRHRDDVRFALVGGAVPGDVKTEQTLCSELARIDPEAAWIRWQGEVGDVRGVMRDSWAIVVPSTRPDPFPNVVLEAMAQGRAVLGTRLGGIPEMIDDGMTGRLVEPGDPSGLADAIEWVVSDRERCEQLGRRGHARAAADFSRQAFIGRWRATLSRALGVRLEAQTSDE